LVVDIEWTLHLIGEEYRDGYLKEIQDYIKENLESFVFVYGAKSDIKIYHKLQSDVLLLPKDFS
jgi:hypothetical protein